MRDRRGFLFAWAPWSIFVLAVAWPTAALIGKSVLSGESPESGFVYTSRELGLLSRSLGLACAATLASIVFSLPTAFTVARLRSATRSPLLAAVLMATLMCPPMVYAFGWEHILPAGVDPYVRCVGVWALWAWPIPALLIGAGWARAGRSAFEAALLDCTPFEAFTRAAFPVLIRYAALAGLVLFVLFFTDYGVPHACGIGLKVIATELLSLAAGSVRSIDTLWPSIPSIVVTAAALTAAFSVWRKCPAEDPPHLGRRATEKIPAWLIAVTFGCFAVSWVVPIATLALRVGTDTGILAEAVTVYGADLAWSLCVAAVAGTAVTVMGVALAAARWFRVMGLVWTVALGAVPGALVGKALVLAYSHRYFSFVFDHWPIVALSYVSRFAWIGLAMGILTIDSRRSEIIAQAATDGAGRCTILARILLPRLWPAWTCGAGIVAALSVAEVAASTLVRVPGASPVAHILIEKFHRFEDGMLVSLSLWLVTASLLAAGLMLGALRMLRRE